MRRTLLLPLLLLALGFAGCASVGNVVSAVTTTITNPVNEVDIYRAKNVYAGTLELAVEWRTYCWSKPYAALMADPIAAPICQDRRATVRKVQAARPKVAAAIRTAENFVRDNPTVNAGSAVLAMWTAVNDFKSMIPAVR